MPKSNIAYLLPVRHIDFAQTFKKRIKTPKTLKNIFLSIHNTKENYKIPYNIKYHRHIIENYKDNE